MGLGSPSAGPADTLGPAPERPATGADPDEGHPPGWAAATGSSEHVTGPEGSAPMTQISDGPRPHDLLLHRDRVLGALARGAPLSEILALLVTSAEEVIPGVTSSVLLLDRDAAVLRTGAAPHLPAFYNEAVDGLPIGPDIGSCGAAAFSGERVIVEDIATHPNWEPFRPLAERAGLRACWSEPIVDPAGVVLGTFAMYYAEARRPAPFELEIIRNMAHVAAVAITRTRAEDELRSSEELFRQLAENIREVFWLTDWVANDVLYVSPAYEDIWGRPQSDLYDDPRSWSEDIHPEDVERVVKAFADDAERGLYDVEYRIVRRDGERRWIHDRAFPIHDASGRVYRVAGISEDITERKQAQLALERARAELDAHTEAQLQSLTTEVLLAEERERRRVAEDLHDGLCQTIALARMKLGMLRPSANSEVSATTLDLVLLEEIEELVSRSHKAARSLTFQLSPPVLHDLGFEAAIEWLADDIHQSYGLPITLHADGASQPLDERVRLLLFRAVRELLINVAKHAHATRAIVKLERSDNQLRILVEDDGVAFDVDTVGQRGLGLSTIRQRLNHLGGGMEIRTRAGNGTSIAIRTPLGESAQVGEGSDDDRTSDADRPGARPEAGTT